MNTIAPPTTLGWHAVRCTTECNSYIHAVFPSVRDAEDWAHLHRHEFPDSASVEVVEIVATAAELTDLQGLDPHTL